MGRIIFHVDVNSAYLSWSAALLLQKGHDLDLRTVPSVVGGNEKNRHGIVLAKSIPAKKYNIQTGEPLRDAFAKCPDLIKVPPDYYHYMKASNAMMEIMDEYSPAIQRFSIDECFLDYTNMTAHFGDPVEAAHKLKEQLKKELGFTVNVGISSNKILSKMASDFSKPDKVHTLWPEEIQEKMWPLPVGDLFMVGRRTKRKLENLGIQTIGDLAKADTDMLQQHLKSYALLIQNYARGIDESIIRKSNHELIKGMGNSTTVKFDVDSKETAYKVLLSLSESVGMRLRASSYAARLVAISITSNEFIHQSHQRKLDIWTDSTTYIYEVAKSLFDELWNEKPIRKLGVRVSELSGNEYCPLSLFDTKRLERYKQIDRGIDRLRERYGNSAVYRACFLHSGLSPVTGGVSEEEDYPVMTSIL